jgi:hypothetical protein
MLDTTTKVEALNLLQHQQLVNATKALYQEIDSKNA